MPSLEIIGNKSDFEGGQILLSRHNQANNTTTRTIELDGQTGFITARNPNNEGAFVNLGWLSDVASISVGGSGAGALNGLDFRLGNNHFMKISESGIVMDRSVGINSSLRVDRLLSSSEGVQVLSAGNPSNSSASLAENNGFEVDGAEANGLFVGRADKNGVLIQSAGNSGVEVVRVGNPINSFSSTAKNGFEVQGAEGNGLFVGLADGNGVHINNTSRNGVFIDFAFDHGMLIRDPRKDGVRIEAAVNDGVRVNSAGGFAGNFGGRVQVTGNLSKGGGSFKIDHPLDPANKYLSQLDFVHFLRAQKMDKVKAEPVIP
ncbi:MAG: hypothetical protein HY314_03535 [Acidobacteria bacterium]|nr:hypothetical protein [Acidobacteriota bacterium]